VVWAFKGERERIGGQKECTVVPLQKIAGKNDEAKSGKKNSTSGK